MHPFPGFWLAVVAVTATRYTLCKLWYHGRAMLSLNKRGELLVDEVHPLIYSKYKSRLAS